MTKLGRPLRTSNYFHYGEVRRGLRDLIWGKLYLGCGTRLQDMLRKMSWS